MKRKDVIAKMQGDNPEEHIAVSVWCAEDVQQQADEDDIELTAEEVNYIVDVIHEKAGGGNIDWVTLGAAIELFNDNLEPDCFACHGGIVYKSENHGEIVICGGCMVDEDAIQNCEKYKRKIQR